MERDGRALWEKLILDGFQAGLSWITILKKRENFRSAFAGFDHIQRAYREAVTERYRFFSYGDAMFLTRQEAK